MTDVQQFHFYSLYFRPKIPLFRPFTGTSGSITSIHMRSILAFTFSFFAYQITSCWRKICALPKKLKVIKEVIFRASAKTHDVHQPRGMCSIYFVVNRISNLVT